MRSSRLYPKSCSAAALTRATRPSESTATTAKGKRLDHGIEQLVADTPPDGRWYW